jgi:hypothetical protein
MDNSGWVSSATVLLAEGIAVVSGLRSLFPAVAVSTTDDIEFLQLLFE